MQYVPVPLFLFVQLKAGLTVSIPVEIYYSINVCYTLIDLKTILSVIITLEQMDSRKEIYQIGVQLLSLQSCFKRHAWN